MPLRPGKACRVNTCSNIASASLYYGYCESHKDRGGWHGNERAKGNRHKRGYGKDWTQLRAVVLQRDKALCQTCLKLGIVKAANQVDHIKPKSQGGTDTLNNLQCLCVECHRTKSATER